MQKLLTLAVPTYNMEKYLARCLDSVLCDNKDYLEVLVVNDGSKDRSSEIGHEYEAKYPNVIRVIDKENGNYGTCVNRALAEAKGKYFRMLDADDWCNTAALNQWLEELKNCDADMVLTQSEDRDANNELLTRMDAPTSVIAGNVYNISEFDGKKLDYKYLYCSHIITYRTSLLRSIGLELQAGISYTDNEYVFFPLDKVKTVVYYALPVYQYFVGREGATTNPAVVEKSVGQMLQVFNRLFESYNANKKGQIDAIRNNELILLVEMLHWIYAILMREPITQEKKDVMAQLEATISVDNDVYISIGKRNRLLRFYRKTGFYPDSIITKTYYQLFSLLKKLLTIAK